MTFKYVEKLLTKLGFVYNKMADSADWMIYENDKYRVYLHTEKEGLYKVEKK